MPDMPLEVSKAVAHLLMGMKEVLLLDELGADGALRGIGVQGEAGAC